MHHHHPHTFTYSEAERRRRQNPEAILAAAGLASGMYCIDVGANDGFFTIPAARIVGETGRVVAIDIDESAINRLRNKLQSADIHTVETIVAPAEDVIVAEHCADVIFFGMVLHDFNDPAIVLRNAAGMLKATGHIYNYDWRKQESPHGPPSAIRFSEAYVEELAAAAGLTTVTSIIVDENFYAMIMKRRD